MKIMKQDHHAAAPPHLQVLLLCLLAACLLSACASHDTRPVVQADSGYFDPHNHLSGVLPWPAHVSLPAYLDALQQQGSGVTAEDKRSFHTWLVDDWHAGHEQALDGRPFASDQRFGLGARAALALYPVSGDLSVAMLDGVLQRVLTATPFTEFDSAYAFHSPTRRRQTRQYYQGDARVLQDQLCTAQVLELARTHITRSEQSISFIGGWRFDDDGHSGRLDTILCAARKPQALRATLGRLDLDAPQIRIILMTHTHQLGINDAGDHFQTFEHTGQCHAEPFPDALRLTPEQMYHALLGENARGEDIIPPGARQEFFATLVGIDTAAPEMTCFSEPGMEYYRALVDAVYRAARARRDMGQDGRLLVHTHVGEGFTAYYAQQPPERPWSFDAVFAELPVLSGNVVTNSRVPHANITMLLDAVAQVRRTHVDLDDYVVIRFGHVTHADAAQAQRMARLNIEADVNLDSNLSTASWSFVDMPAGERLARRASRAAVDPHSNLALNDLPHFLLPDPNDAQAVAGVFGTHALKHLLMAGVRVMLGTDGAGVEHASMPREYALAASLIRYWKSHDDDFARAVGDLDADIFLQHAAAHLDAMQGKL